MVIILSLSHYGFLWSQEIVKETFTYKDTLQLDFYSIIEKINPERPLIVIVHGGGFSKGKRDGSKIVKFANYFVAQGYAVASISYHLTRRGTSFGCDCSDDDKVKTFVDVAQNIADAVLFLQNKSNEFEFDIDKTILMGSSAGAEGVLNLVFMKDDYRFSHIPKFPVAGIISLAGAVLDKEYITDSTKVPVMFFHGVKDKLVPYETASHHFCNSDTDGYLILDGSEAMAKRLELLNTSYILAFSTEGGHEWATLGYKYTDLIKCFIEQVIILKLFLQTKIQLKK
ncbi:MAG: carboxylesterase family protein [Flavobacteriaceae bacterium]|nr:carboxylesterase family protein [Flavobacteriaceae bacterium]